MPAAAAAASPIIDGDIRRVREARGVPQARIGALLSDGIVQGGGRHRRVQRGRCSFCQGVCPLGVNRRFYLPTERIGLEENGRRMDVRDDWIICGSPPYHLFTRLLTCSVLLLGSKRMPTGFDVVVWYHTGFWFLSRKLLFGSRPLWVADLLHVLR